MKETVASFMRRTGEPYAPAGMLRLLGTPLGPRDACPTLFRQPGPEGIRDLLQGALCRLAPAERDHLWLTSRPTGAYARVVAELGTVAVLQPLRFTPCRTHCFQHTRDNWVAANRAVEDDDTIVFVPPAWTNESIAWDRLATAAEARRAMGSRYADEVALARERVFAYLEELSDLRRAGAPGPSGHWCEEPVAARRALLARYGLRPLWTRA
jgi:hypothetical protein